MEWLQLLIAFFLANVFGYGGGPASIPLMHNEIVERYGWLSNQDFTNVLALGNALPGPIATKIAAYVGYDIGGWIGFILALSATVVPSAIATILLIRLMQRFRQSNVVKGMTLTVQPVIAIMMLLLTWQSLDTAILDIGWLQSLGIAAVAAWLIIRRKTHPAMVIVAAFLYGGFVLS